MFGWHKSTVKQIVFDFPTDIKFHEKSLISNIPNSSYEILLKKAINNSVRNIPPVNGNTLAKFDIEFDILSQKVNSFIESNSIYDA